MSGIPAGRRDSLLSSAASGAGAFAIPALTALVTAPFLANGLGARAFAVYSLAVACSGAAAALGLSRAVVRELSHPPFARPDEYRRAIVVTALWMAAGLGLALGAALAVSADGIARMAGAGREADATVLRLAALGVLPMSVGAVALAVPQGLGRWRMSARLSVGAAVLTSVGGASLAWMGAGPWAVVLWAAAVSTGAACAALLVAHTLMTFRFDAPSWTAARTLVGLGGEILGAQVVFAVWVLAERMIVSRLLGPPALAAYVVALLLGAYLQAAVVAVAQVFAPSAHHASGDSAAVQQLYSGAAGGVAILSLAGAATIAGAGRPFLELWMGAGFAQAAAPALLPLALAFGLNSLTSAAWFVGEGLGQQRRNLVAAVISAVLGLTALVALVPSWQMAGAGAARLCAMALAPAYVWWIERSATPPLRGPWRSVMLIVVPASGALGLALHMLLAQAPASWPWLVICCATGWAAYGTLAWHSGALAAAQQDRARRWIALAIARATRATPRAERE